MTILIKKFSQSYLLQKICCNLSKQRRFRVVFTKNVIDFFLQSHHWQIWKDQNKSSRRNWNVFEKNSSLQKRSFFYLGKRQGQEDLSCRQQVVVGFCIENMGQQQGNIAHKKRFWNPLLTTFVHVSIWIDSVDNSFLSSKAKNSVFLDKIRNFLENKDLPTQTQSVFQSILGNSIFQIFFVKNFGEKINFPKMPEVLETFLKKKSSKNLKIFWYRRFYPAQ